MEKEISPKQILADLLSIFPQVKFHFRNELKYKELINYLSAKDYYNDEELRYPTLKQISSETGLNSYRLRKQLIEIYNKIFVGRNDILLDFSNIEVQFFVSYFKRYASFSCKNLTNIPRVGENMNLPFLKARLGIGFFYVDDIHHSFENCKQIIELHLKGGFYNSYWQYRYHQAIERGEISWKERCELYEYQLKERLGLRPI